MRFLVSGVRVSGFILALGFDKREHFVSLVLLVKALHCTIEYKEKFAGFSSP